MSDSHILVGIGNPLLDISATVPEELLTRYGVSLNNAILASEEHLPIYQELLDNFECDITAGGATQNSMRVAQWMTQTPGATGFLGCIGQDIFGSKLQESASKDGVKTYYQIDPSTPTGTCAALIHNKERSLVANIAAANNFQVDHLRANFAIVEAAQFFYVSGFFLTVSVESILEIAEHALSTNKTFGLNIAAEFVVEFFKDGMMQVFPYTDFVFGNETEAIKFSKVHNFETEDFSQIALKMSALEKKSERPRTVVITRGKDPTIVACGEDVKYFDVEVLDPSLIVDTNGAGDAFVGGFLSQLIKGEDVEKCVRAGHYAGREIIQQSGCVFPEAPSFS